MVKSATGNDYAATSTQGTEGGWLAKTFMAHGFRVVGCSHTAVDSLLAPPSGLEAPLANRRDGCVVELLPARVGNRNFADAAVGEHRDQELDPGLAASSQRSRRVRGLGRLRLPEGGTYLARWGASEPVLHFIVERDGDSWLGGTL